MYNLSNTNFVEVSLKESMQIDGGAWLANTLMFVGGVIALFASGPVGFIVGFAIAFMGFAHSMNW